MFENLTIKQYPPQIEEQISATDERIKELQSITNPAICKVWLANEIRMQKAIYQSLCVATEAEAIDWADNENFSEFNLEDKHLIADILKGTIFEKEVNNG